MLLLKEDIEKLVYPPDSKPFHVPFRGWAARWWKWLHSIPKDKSPANDNTGEFCDVSQPYPNVWLLAGTLGGSATRYCRIPNGRAILFPLITSAFSFAVDPHLRTEEELSKATKLDMDKVVKLSLSFNGFGFENLDRFRILTGPFEDVIDGKPTTAVSDGFWIFLRPLKDRKFKIYFVGQSDDFFNEVTYNLSTY